MSTPICFRVSILLTCFFALSAPSLCQGIDIATSGSGWSPSIDSSLISAPGSNLPSTLASDPSIISISVTNTANGNWHINVKKTNGAWNSNLHISVKRTGGSTTSGNLSGGTNFQEVTAMDVRFFSGRGDSLDVTVGLELTGVSIQVPPNTGSTDVTFTVVAGP